MRPRHEAELLLVVAAVLAVVALVLLALWLRARAGWRAARAEVEALQADLDAALRPRPPTNPAERAVRAVVGTAARVRRDGVGSFVASSLEDLTTWALEKRPDLLRVADADGVLTLLFSDIEDSTRLNAKLGDRAWVRLLGAHDAIVRDAVEAQRGQVVKSAGDGFMVAFRDATAATLAARAIQRSMARTLDPRLRRTPVKVRVGLHTGRAISRDGDYFGRNVAMAARVAARAAGGEVLASDATFDAVDDPRLVWEEAEVVELKGLPGEHRLWRLVVDD